MEAFVLSKVVKNRCIHSSVFFFFKQKTAYEIVSRDWSSDVCSSDLFCLLSIWSMDFIGLVVSNQGMLWSYN